MNMMLLLSFLFFMLIFAGVGLASMLVKQDTTDDYLVAGRGMHPALAALSAVSTWNSGYMFIGFIGFTYAMGYSVIWIGLASTIGQLIAWMWLYKYIQEEGRERGVRSLSSLVSDKAGSPEAKLAAVLSVMFLAVYAAAQLTSGGKALFVMMGWSEVVGILIGFVLVVAYCYAGGIRASIWTDAAQSCVMIVGSTILCYVALDAVGGFSNLGNALESEDPNLTKIFPSGLLFGVSLWIAAFFLGGLGVAGQPQVVSRVMTLESDKDRVQAMIWFFVWQTPFILLMLVVGWCSRILFTASDFDPELGLPSMAMETMPAFGVGMILASIFAATMSTADSQVLACTAAITDDIKPEWREDHKTTKKVTLAMAALATFISIAGLYIPGGDSVFSLVVLAVYGLGGIFIPLLTIRWMGYQPDSKHTISMMIAALSAVILWRISGMNVHVFESIPAMTAAFAIHFVFCKYREDSPSQPFGRYTISDTRKGQLRTGAAVVLVLVAMTEAVYALNYLEEEPTSGGVGNYDISTNLSLILIHEGTDYFDDGESVRITVNTGDINLDGKNIVGAILTLEYGEDETSNGPTCGLPNQGDAEPDSILSRIRYGDSNQSATGENQEGETANHNVSISWYNTSLNGKVSGLSESQIIDELDSGGKGTGEYTIRIEVSAESGGGTGCNHEDNGEEIDYTLHLMILDYVISPVST